MKASTSDGARDELHLQGLRGLLARATHLAIEERDFEDAAALYRRCRQAGATPRRQVDCLIAALAVRTATPLLHADTDFEILARHTDLEISPL